jgi:hypothetical protein
MSMPEHAQASPSTDWRHFQLKRLRMFAGRSLGSLNEREFAGLINSQVLEKIQVRWAEVDPEVREMFHAITARVAFEQAASVNPSEATLGPLTMAGPPSTFDDLPESPSLTAEQQPQALGSEFVSVPVETSDHHFVLRPSVLAAQQQAVSPARESIALADKNFPASSNDGANGGTEQRAVEHSTSDERGDRRLVIFQHICAEIRRATTLPEALSIKALTENLKLQSLLEQDKEAQRRYAAARLAAMQKVGEIISDLEKQTPVHDDTGRFDTPKTPDLPSVESRSKTAILKENRISLSTANRYEKLAGPPEPKIRKAVHQASEEYFSDRLEQGQMPKAGELLEVVETVTGTGPKPKKEPSPSKHFMMLLADFEAHPDNYNPENFAKDPKLLALYQRTGEKLVQFLGALDVELLGCG